MPCSCCLAYARRARTKQGQDCRQGGVKVTEWQGRAVAVWGDWVDVYGTGSLSVCCCCAVAHTDLTGNGAQVGETLDGRMAVWMDIFMFLFQKVCSEGKQLPCSCYFSV
jgi:hypothetical protein